MQIEFIPLGTNGHIPTDGRHTMSFLLLHESCALILDAGTGIARLCEKALQEKLAKYDTLHVLLSHFHLDHSVGLFYLLGSWNDKQMHLHVPQLDDPSASGLQAMEKYFAPPFVPKTLDQLADRMKVSAIRSHEYSVGPFTMSLWPQKHPGGSIGVRIGNLLAYATDKSVRDDELDHIRDVAYLVHEVWLTDEEAEAKPEQLQGHSSVSAVAAFARLAGVRHLMPVHHHPKRLRADIEQMAKKLGENSGVPTILLEEGHTYTLRDDR